VKHILHGGKVRNKTLLFYAVFLSTSGCSSCFDSDDFLTKICPIGNKCIIKNNKTILFDGMSKNDRLSASIGECSLGTVVECDANDKPNCKNFVGPEEEKCDLEKKDENCNGIVNEGFDNDGDGYTSCEGDCNDISGSIHPNMLEACDGVDQNCNGQIDENIIKDCWTYTVPYRNLSFSVNSKCKTGHSKCRNGYWAMCEGEVWPEQYEDCLSSTIDDDCDGQINEPEENICGPQEAGTGECKLGTQFCVGVDAVCFGAVFPTIEICDNFDQSCNGLVDENVVRECRTVCGAGVEYCDKGNWVGCTARNPTEEICNGGIDDDCDFLTTEENCICVFGESRTCSNPLDANTLAPTNCGIGMQTCSTIGEWGKCIFYDVTEEKCNNYDDDCENGIDGIIKECASYDNELIGVGECESGQKTCINGVWSQCEGEVIPKREICNNLDDNCSGDVDEDLNPHEKVDIVFAIDTSGSMINIINAMISGINNYAYDFINHPEHKFGLVTFPPSLMRNEIVSYIPVTGQSPVDVMSFENILNLIEANGGGDEQAWDVVYDLTKIDSPFQWRQDAYPYIILMTDESAETWYGFNENDVARQTIDCLVGSCSMNSTTIEIFIFTGPEYFVQWDAITSGDSRRLKEINPQTNNLSLYYTETLRDIFSNVCFFN